MTPIGQMTDAEIKRELKLDTISDERRTELQNTLANREEMRRSDELFYPTLAECGY